MSLLRKIIVLSSGISLLGLLVFQTPAGLFFEEMVGLKIYFKLRGARQPPDNVVIVSVNKESADKLGIHPSPAKWPRSLHASLVQSLSRLGAALIAFDIFFEDSRSQEDDRLFADAMRAAGNVILFARLARERQEEHAGMHLEKLTPPIAVLAHAAAGTAPFPLPKIPVRLNQYWAFKEGAGEKATLPVVAAQLYARGVIDTLIGLIAAAEPSLAAKLGETREKPAPQRLTNFVQAAREAFAENNMLADNVLAHLTTLQAQKEIDGKTAGILSNLILMYAGPESRYLNFFGPAATIPTISFHRFISGEAEDAPLPDLRGKAVFIGYSEITDADQKDNFFTVFSGSDGTDLCGVEIIATAFANLRANDALRPLYGWQLSLLALCWALLLCVIACTLPLIPGALVVLLLSGAYLLVGVQQFTNTYTWYPLFVPLFLQAPLALGCSFLVKFRETGKEKETARKALDYYLPPQFAKKLGKNFASVVHTENIEGICLFTDAADFTAFSEKMSSGDLAGSMRSYFEKMFAVIERNGGIPVDIRGDAIMAIWEIKSDEAAAWLLACQAALEINRTAGGVERDCGAINLATRIGLHSGTMTLGNIGARGRYQCTIMGDAVNTASRLESLNKQLGTDILISRDIAPYTSRFLTRNLGRFLFKGKTEAVEVHELVTLREEAGSAQLEINELFARGLHLFRQQEWRKAAGLFAEVEQIAGKNGPAAFYARLCGAYQDHSPSFDLWDGVVRLSNK